MLLVSWLSIGNMNFLRNIRVSTKVTLTNVIGMLLLGGSVLFVVSEVLKAELEHQAIEMQRLTIEIAWSTLNETGSGFTVRDGKLMVGDVALTDNNAMVDKVRHLTGGSATIFQGDTRI